jgi:hypothetical protein
MTESIKCGECGESLDGLPDLPAPCPCCGSTRRKFDKLIPDAVVLSDHDDMLGKRNGKSFTFRQSRRSDGRAASADCDDGLLSYSVSGSSPQGEESTLEVCKLLIQKLNLDGSAWDEPVQVKGSDVDCETTDINNPSQRLQIQVVRAIADQELWKYLNTRGTAQESNVDPSILRSYIEKAIKKKEKSARKGLTLVLDATLLPGIALDEVIEVFRDQRSAWASSLGFEGIWLVGPVNELVQRLDQLRSNERLENSGG